MKKLICLSLIAFSATAFAQDEAVTYTDSAMVLDLGKACWDKGNIKVCNLNEYGIDAVITGVETSLNSAGHYSHYTIDSRVPILQLEYKCEYRYSSTYYCGRWASGKMTGAESSTSGNKLQTFEGTGVLKLDIKPDYAHSFQKIYFNNGIPTALNASLSSAIGILKGAYSGVNRNLELFRGEIAKSHRGHLERLSAAIKEGIALTSAKDKSGKPLYSIVDWRIQENSRLIVVFGTVLNELLTDYDDVQRLKTSINAVRTLVEQLRLSYGWNTGLAGTVSKASSSLIDVVRLELQELASIKMAMGSGEFQIYLDLLRVTRTLQAKVDASKSGDMRAQREIFAVVDLWNGKLWQDELGRLMNAGPDFKNLVIPKLSMLLYAVESIAELSEQDFIIPDRALLK